VGGAVRRSTTSRSRFGNSGCNFTRATALGVFAFSWPGSHGKWRFTSVRESVSQVVTSTPVTPSPGRTFDT
jgi:hypothetical protein